MAKREFLDIWNLEKWHLNLLFLQNCAVLLFTCYVQLLSLRKWMVYVILIPSIVSFHIHTRH